MKKLIIIIIVLFSVNWAYSNKEKIMKTGNKKTGVTAYNEIRMKYLNISRDIELVSFIKRDSGEACKYASEWFSKRVLNCVGNEQCKVLKNRCIAQVPARYQKMFNEEKASTIYFKAEEKDDDKAAIILFWGLNNQEAQQACNLIKSGAEKRPASKDVVLKCI